MYFVNGDWHAESNKNTQKIFDRTSDKDLPHVEVTDDYSGILFRIVTAIILSNGCVLLVENTAVQYWRVSTAFYVWKQLRSSEVPFGVASHETWEEFSLVEGHEDSISPTWSEIKYLHSKTFGSSQLLLTSYSYRVASLI